jgi:hypothetical protein
MLVLLFPEGLYRTAGKNAKKASQVSLKRLFYEIQG